MSTFGNIKRGTAVKGIFAHLDLFMTAADRLKKAGFRNFEVLSPLPRHEVLDVVSEGRPSPVRWWTLTGGITGITCGFLLTSLTAIQWPMINPGGKPVVSLPPYAVIMFECTILFGALFTLAGLLVHCGLPSWGLNKSLQDPRCQDDKFGIVFLDAKDSDLSDIVEVLRGAGAIEVTTGDDTIYEVPNA